jgi:DNA helicase IV
LATQSAVARETQLEQAYVDRVIGELKRASASAKDLAGESRARFTSNRETRVREEDGTALFERDAFAFLAARRLADLEGQHEGLVFGRLDFLDQEKRYVGRLGVRTADYEPLVIDWRAQAAEPFYRATPVEPMDVVRRRVLTSRDDRVTGIEDDVLMPTSVPSDMVVIGDGALMQALGRARGPQMHDIVATIQAEQDEVIRAPYQGFTIISGGPGTGKTVVGLHRVAFLLYTYRRRFANGGVLVVGPSPVFMNYIAKVLPSLGEDAVVMRALGQVAEDVLGLTSDIRDDEAAWVIKGGLSMRQVLRRLIEHSPVDDGLTVIVDGEPLSIRPAELDRIRREVLAKSTYNQGRTLATRAVVEHFRAVGVGLVDVTDAEFADKVRDFWSFAPFMDRWWPLLDPTTALATLRDPQFGVAVGQLDQESATVLAQAIDPEHWTIGDIPLLDELALMLGPVPTTDDSEPIFLPPNAAMKEIVTISDKLTDRREVASGAPHATYAHILVDEAQDITPMQWRMLRRRGPSASWTILGDPAQSSWPDRTEPQRALLALVGNRAQRSFRLSTNYRSPKESYDLATSYIKQIEPDADIPTSVRSTGVEPRLLVAPLADLAEAVAAEVNRLLKQVDGTIAVIAPSKHLLAAEESRPDDERVMVLTPLNAKGLEFDAVVVVDPDRIAEETPAGPRVLYVALTRPTQRLVTIDVDRAGTWRPLPTPPAHV